MQIERLLFKPILPTSVFYEMRYPVTLIDGVIKYTQKRYTYYSSASCQFHVSGFRYN